MSLAEMAPASHVCIVQYLRCTSIKTTGSASPKPENSGSASIVTFLRAVDLQQLIDLPVHNGLEALFH